MVAKSINSCIKGVPRHLLLAGHAFEEFAKPMFDRCISIVTQQLAGRASAANGQPTEPEPDRDFIICSLDVIAGEYYNLSYVMVLM